jgi:twitching motility protein PilT
LGETGRIAAFEIMTGNAAVRNLIREGKVASLASTISISSKDGMQTLDQALADLVKKGLVAKAEALKKSSTPEQLDKLIQFSGLKVY